MKTVNVVAALIINQDQVFATQRGYGEFKDGWEFPGGKIEPGETPEEALKREIQEELAAIAEKIGTRVVMPPIRRTIRVQQAHAHRMPVIYYDKNCTAAQDYMALVDSLVGGN